MSGSLLSGAGRAAYQLSFQISPIILTGGIAQNTPGGMLPIVAILETANFLTGLLSGDLTNLTLDRYFAHFRPLPGSTLIDNQYGTYPFLNQQVAANAVVVQPSAEAWTTGFDTHPAAL